MPDGRPGLAGLDDDMMDRIERGLLTKVEAELAPEIRTAC